MAQLTCHNTPNLAASRAQPAASASRSGFFQGNPVLPACRFPTPPLRRAALSIEARYRGRGTDLSKIDQFKRHANDVGSTEIQIARISARVLQLTSHLKEHRKDYAATRGLIIMLGQRRRLMQYLYRMDRPKYESVLRELNVRPLKVQASRGVVVKLTEGAEVEVMAAADVQAAAGV